MAVWHWELPNGARIYTDGCFAPAGDGPPVPVVDFHHELHWIDADGKETSYGRDGDDVTGVAGHVDLVLEGGRTIGLDADGRWAQRYGPLGGGLNEMMVRSSDGWEGTAIYEVTGAHHHRYFPVARADGPAGLTRVRSCVRRPHVVWVANAIWVRQGGGNGLGLRDRSGVPDEARLGRRVRPRGDRAAGSGLAAGRRTRRPPTRCARSSIR